MKKDSFEEVSGRTVYRRDINYVPIILECVECKKNKVLSIAFTIMNGNALCDEHFEKS